MIEDMLNDTLEGLDDEDVEDVANSEVEKILTEIMEGAGPIPAAPNPEPVRVHRNVRLYNYGIITS